MTGATIVNRPSMSAEEFGFALLLSIPVGAGVSTAMLRVTERGFTDPLVAGPGAVTALSLFAFLVIALHSGGNRRSE